MNTRIGSLVVATVTLLTLAQTGAAQIAFKGGVSLTDFVGADVGTIESTPGLNLGASIGLFRIGPVKLMGEIFYRQKGSLGDFSSLESFAPTADGSPPAGLESIEVGLDYIEIPLLARVDFGGVEGKLLPYLFGGPAFGWQIDCGVAVSAATGRSETKCDDLSNDLENTLRSYEMGLVLGGGMDLYLPGGIGVLNLDARYTAGLSRVGEGDEALDIRNRALTVMLGYSFGMPGMGAGGTGIGRRVGG